MLHVHCVLSECKRHHFYAVLLPRALIIDLAQSLWRMILLTEKDQHQQCEYVRQHHYQVLIAAGHFQYFYQLIAAGAGEAKQQAGAQCGHDLPVAEDQRGDGQIAVAGINIGRKVSGDRIGKTDAAKTGQRAGSHNGDQAYAAYFDTGRIHRMWIVAAGAQMQAESGLVQDVPGDDGDQRNDDLEGVEVCKYRTQHGNPGKSGHRDTGRYAQHELIGSGAEDAGVDLFGQKFGQRHSQDIDDNAADHLVGFEFDTEHGMQQRKKHTAQEGKEHRQIEGNRRVACKILCDTDRKQCAAEGAETLQSFDCQIGDAAPLTIDTADRHDEQRKCEG